MKIRILLIIIVGAIVASIYELVFDLHIAEIGRIKLIGHSCIFTLEGIFIGYQMKRGKENGKNGC